MVIRPCSIPKQSQITLAGRASPLVVHEALLITWWLSGSYVPSFTPSTTVTSSFLAGALMMTFDAPASRWACAFSPSVKMPVDSITMSTPSARRKLYRLPLAEGLDGVAVDRDLVVAGRHLAVEAAIGGVVLEQVGVGGGGRGSLMATTSRSSGCRSIMALSVWRPIRPKPLMPIRVTARSSCVGHGRSSAAVGRVVEAFVDDRQQADQ